MKQTKKIFIIFWLIFLLFFLCLSIYFYRQKNIAQQKLNSIKKEINKKNLLEQKKLEDKKKKELDFIKNLDLYSDSSLTKFVSAENSFNKKNYIPKNLVSIKSKYIIDAKWWQKLRKEAFLALEKMAKKYYNDTKKKIVVVSAYRSYLYQKGIKDRWCPDNLCAKAWYSEHQSWLAVDLFSASSNYTWKHNKKFLEIYSWLEKNAANFWFTNTYQKWLKVDTYEIEPWHWRYVWVDLAKYLQKNNLTFKEFFDKQKKN